MQLEVLRRYPKSSEYPEFDRRKLRQYAQQALEATPFLIRGFFGSQGLDLPSFDDLKLVIRDKPYIDSENLITHPYVSPLATLLIFDVIAYEQARRKPDSPPRIVLDDSLLRLLPIAYGSAELYGSPRIIYVHPKEIDAFLAEADVDPRNPGSTAELYVALHAAHVVFHEAIHPWLGVSTVIPRNLQQASLVQAREFIALATSLSFANPDFDYTYYKLDGSFGFSRQQLVRVIKVMTPKESDSPEKYFFAGRGCEYEISTRIPEVSDPSVILRMGIRLQESIVESMAILLLRQYVSQRFGVSRQARKVIDRMFNLSEPGYYKAVLHFCGNSIPRLVQALLDGSFYQQICAQLSFEETLQLAHALLPPFNMSSYPSLPAEVREGFSSLDSEEMRLEMERILKDKRASDQRVGDREEFYKEPPRKRRSRRGGRREKKS